MNGYTLEIKNLLCFGLLCATLIAPAFAQKDEQAEVILDAMSNKYKKMPAFKAEFSYAMQDLNNAVEDKLTGTVWVMSDKYKLLMGGQEIMFDGKHTYTYLKEEQEVTIDTPDPDESEISLTNIFDLYKKGFKYLYNGTIDHGKVDVVDLVPEDRNKDYFKIRMEIMAKSKNLKRFKIFDKSGSKYVYHILSFKKDPTIQESLFRFDPKKHPSVEVIDFR